MASLKVTFAYIVERETTTGPAVPVALGERTGALTYAESWRTAAKFYDWETARRFLLLAERSNLPKYGNMTGKYVVAKHEFGIGDNQ